MQKLFFPKLDVLSQTGVNPQLLVLLVAGSLTTMTGGLVTPVLPEIQDQLHLEPRLVAYLGTMHCWTIALFSPLLGILADRFGRLQVLVASLSLYGVFGTAGATATSFLPLLVSRGLLGAATGGIAAASLGLLGSMYEGKARSQALGYATGTLTLAGIIFPLTGGLIGLRHWQYAFYLYSIGLPLAILAAITLQQQPSSQTEPQISDEEPNYKLRQVFAQPETLWLLLTLALASVVMYSVVIFAPLYFKATIQANSVLNGTVLAFRAVGAAVVSAFGARRLSQTLGLSLATSVGFGLMAVTLGIIPLLHQMSWILLTAVLFGAGFGIVLPNLYHALANKAPAKLRSSVLSAGTGASFLGQSLSPILLGSVLNYSGLEVVFYTAAGLSIVAGILLLLGKNRLENDEL